MYKWRERESFKQITVPESTQKVAILGSKLPISIVSPTVQKTHLNYCLV